MPQAAHAPTIGRNARSPGNFAANSGPLFAIRQAPATPEMLNMILRDAPDQTLETLWSRIDGLSNVVALIAESDAGTDELKQVLWHVFTCLNDMAILAGQFVKVAK